MDELQHVDDAVVAATGRRNFSWRRVVLVVVPLAIVTTIALWRFYDAAPRDAARPLAGPGAAIKAPLTRHPFDLSQALVPPDAILAGGPPVDGIPALSQPAMVSPGEATYLVATNRVVGVEFGDQARAYPLKILNFHEIVNDSIAGRAIAVTYCPLCDSAAVIDRDQTIGGREFGVSGLLYNSNVLMYDRDAQTSSLWSQLLGRAIAGPLVEQPLVYLPATLTTWQAWQERHPETTVLSDETGHHRTYDHNPYAAYFQANRLMFPVAATSDRLPPRMPVVGVWSDTTYRAYPASLLTEERTLTEQIGGKSITLARSPGGGIRVVQADPGLQWVYSFWFAWYAMHPETEVAN